MCDADHLSPWHSLPSDLEERPGLRPIFQIPWLPLDLADHSVSLPEEKPCRILLKLRLFLDKPCVSQKDCASLHGSLQHVSFVYCDTWNSLLALSAFLSKFPNDYVLHYAPCTVTNDLTLWLTCLTGLTMTHSLLPRQRLDPNLVIDTSLSFGLSFAFDNRLCWL